MNRKALKKIKKIYNRDLAEKAEKEAHELALTFFQHIVKPKPRFIPLWV